MRNIFDQYSQPENRVTHALMSALASDRRLLVRFVRWSVGRDIGSQRTEVREQSLPGEVTELSEEEAEHRGLPDGCISTSEGWTLLIESKFAAHVTTDQIRRHLRTAVRRGYEDAVVLVLTVRPPHQRLSKGVIVKQWSDVYKWLRSESAESKWARNAADYLEVAEARGVADQYLKEGTLTIFSGVNFGPEQPYTYLEAKRCLKLLRGELCGLRRLERELGADLKATGRGAITGRSSDLVWDYIPLKASEGASVFTQYPHLTISLLASRMEAYVTVPNGIKSRLRSKMLGGEFESFERLILGVTVNLVRLCRHVKGATPMIVLVQRHYPSQRSEAVHDSILRFDPRTALSESSPLRGAVKSQPQWLRTVYDALESRRSNLQFQVGVDFPYRDCAAVRDRGIVEVVADTWIACQPVVKAATD